MSYSHQIRVRYSEVDVQRVVFNANYLSYCDDAFESWVGSCCENGLESLGWDIVVTQAVINWHAPARVRDRIDLLLRVVRWGNTSFDVSFEATIRGNAAFTAHITYVGVRHGTSEPCPPPEVVRQFLE